MQKRYLILYSLISIVSILMLTICLKHYVHNLHDQISVLDKQITEEKMSIHVLSAELAYLNRPERLQELNDKYLKFSSVKGEQVQYIDQGTEKMIAQNTEVNSLMEELNQDMSNASISIGSAMIHKVGLER